MKLAVLLLLLGSAFAHPLCLDSSDPVDTTLASPVCLAYPTGELSCCATAATEAANVAAVSAASGTCEAAALSVACGACDPWSQHLHEDTSTKTLRVVPWLCKDACIAFADACAGETVSFSHALNGNLTLDLTAVTSNLDTQEAWCTNHSLSADSDSGFCYDGTPFVPLASEPTADVDNNLVCVTPLAGDDHVYLSVVDIPGTDDAAAQTQQGVVYRVPRTHGALDWEARAVLLDITSRVKSGGEQGLLSIAFVPGSDSRLLVSYSCAVDTPECAGTCTSDADCGPAFSGTCDVPSGTCDGVSHFSTVEEWNLAANPPALSHRILSEPQPYGNHNGGQLLWASDQALFIMLGDGGSAGDPQDLAQNLESPLGSILRVSPTGDALADNPFVDVPLADPRTWAYGLRNPWRCSLDRASPAHMLCGDVGQGTWEEVTRISKGTNAGWRPFEGSSVYQEGEDVRGPSPHTPPILEYNHDGATASVCGGYVVRPGDSEDWQALSGAYLYADYRRGLRLAVSDATQETWSDIPIDPFLCINCTDQSGSPTSHPEFGAILSFAEVDRVSQMPTEGADYLVLATSGVYKLMPPAVCQGANFTDPAVPTPEAATSHAEAGPVWVTVLIILAITGLGALLILFVLCAK